VTQLSYTFRPRRRSKRLRHKQEGYQHPLRALALREKKIHIVGSPELKIEGTPIYIDVEGLPDRDFYYLISMRLGSGTSAIQHSFWRDDLCFSSRKVSMAEVRSPGFSRKDKCPDWISALFERGTKSASP
jgi:hypothetical protein